MGRKLIYQHINGEDLLIEVDEPKPANPKRSEWKKVRETHPELSRAISSCLFRHDPVGINYVTNTDEYDPEACTILQELEGCRTVEDVQRMVYTTFCDWFDEQMIGDPESFRGVSEEIWGLWTSRK
jgi:hypothetical protein